MIASAETLPRKSRFAALLDHFAEVEDPRERTAHLHPLPEVLLLVVCGAIADCDDYEDIAAWGAAHLGFLRRHLPYAHGVPGERWRTILMNRIDPALFAAAFADWVRESWPEKAGLVAIDGKTARRSHDRGAGSAPLHLVSAFATTAHLALAQEAVPGKANELAAIPPLLERLGAEKGLEGALVSIDAIATNAEAARAIAAQGADWLLAVKANQPSLRTEPSPTRPAPSRPTPTWTRDTAASRSAAPPSSARSTGSTAPAASRASCACPAPPASSAPRPASRAGAPHGPRPATPSPHAPAPPPMLAEVAAFFADLPALPVFETADADHARVDVRRHWVSHDVAWLFSDRRYAGEPKLPRPRHHRPRRGRAHRRRQDKPHGTPLCQLRHPVAGALRPRRPRPLGDREQPSLDPRRHLRRGPRQEPKRQRA